MDLWLKLVYGSGFDRPLPAQAARSIPPRDPSVACAIGDDRTLVRLLDNDPDWANRADGPLGMPPLVAVTFSSLVQLAVYAEPLRRCCKLLLERGADVTQSWIDPSCPESPLMALHGAAGRNHDSAMTRLLLQHGANPDDNESLYHAAESSDLTCLRLLLDAGAKIDGTNALCRILDFGQPAWAQAARARRRSQ